MTPIFVDDNASSRSNLIRSGYLAKLKTTILFRSCWPQQLLKNLEELCSVWSKVLVLNFVFQTQSPTHAYHKSGIRVNLLRKKKKYQFFHMSRCRPTLEPLTQVTGARCKTVKINHKALIRVTLSQQRQAAANGTPFANCKPPKYGFVICDDWVQLDGYCAMFV